eukprot:6491300-Amphidinium_carterae.1
MFSETAVKDAMNKELSQLLSRQSFKKKVDKRSLTATRWVITQRPTNNGTKDIKCRFCGKRFSQFIHDTDIQTFAATPSMTSMAMCLLLTIAIIKQFTVYTTDVANAFLNIPIDEEVIVQPLEAKGVLPQSTQYIVEDDKSTLRSTHITQTMARTSQYNPTKTWFHKTLE